MHLKNGQTRFALIALQLTTLFVASSSNPPCQQAIALEHKAKQAISTDFALNLFRHETVDLSKNVFISPFSAYMALSMATNGAAGQTKAQMAQMIGAPVGDLSQFNASNREVLLALNKNTHVRMEIADALFADQRFPLQQSFLDLCRASYAAEVRNENFEDPLTVRRINNWCDQKTHGKIKEIVQNLRDIEGFILLNSVYFKGAWADHFEESATKPGDFKLLNGGTKQVPMMHASKNYKYLDGSGFKAVSLPYNGYNQSMYLFLPDAGCDFHAFISSFTSENWKQWMKSFHGELVSLSFPKFTTACEYDFKKVLMAMGMKSAFSGATDFRELSEKPLQLSRVLQKTYIDVDENGTEAAAVTAIPSRGLDQEEKIKTFDLDRPFVVAIVDYETSEILFLGAILDPSTK
jgi:serine protease inhibitor